MFDDKMLDDVIFNVCKESDEIFPDEIKLE